MAQLLHVHPDNPQVRLLKTAVQWLQSGGVLAVPIASGTTFSPGTPQLLFKFAGYGLPFIRLQFAVSPDGQRFLVNKVLLDRGRTILLQNWLQQAQQ